MRWEIRSTSSILWLTKTSATPLSLSDFTIRNSDWTSRQVSAVVGSSMKMMRASWASARQIAVSWRSATDRVGHRRVEVEVDADPVDDFPGDPS